MDNTNMLFLLLMVASCGMISAVGCMIYLHDKNTRLVQWADRLAHTHKGMAAQLASRNQFLWDKDLLKDYKQWFLKPSNLMADADLIPWRDPRDPEVGDKLRKAMIEAHRKIDEADIDIISLPDRSTAPAKPELGERVALGFLKT